MEIIEELECVWGFLVRLDIEKVNQGAIKML
jgi:hypothetical protein